jgi:hypothetical protein
MGRRGRDSDASRPLPPTLLLVVDEAALGAGRLEPLRKPSDTI